MSKLPIAKLFGLGNKIHKKLTMYIYNVTINIDDSIHDQWLIWMNTEHIPAMLATGKFSRGLMTRVIVDGEMEGKTYSVQYTTENKETLEKYYAEDAAELRARSKPFEGRFVAFRTELEVVAEHHSNPTSTAEE